MLVSILLFLIATLVLTIDSGAAEVVDNFEWKVPGMNRENGCDQWTEGILTDEVTGEVYVVYQNREPYSQDWSNDSIVCARLDPDTGTLTDRWVYHYPVKDRNMYYYFPKNRQYLVHDDHFYFLYYTREDMTVHLRIDDMSEDQKRWYIGEFQLRILGVREGNLTFIVDNWERDAVVLFTVSLDNFTTKMKDIFTYSFDTTGRRYQYRNGAVHAVFWKQTRHSDSTYSYNLMIDRHYIDLELRLGPTSVDVDAIDYPGTTNFDVDSEGNCHIMYVDYYGSDQWLHKVTTSGDVVASIDLDHLMDDIDVNFTEPWLYVLVNRTDQVYLLGRFTPNHYGNSVLCSFAISPTYDGTMLRHFIYPGLPNLNYRFDHVVMNRTGEIFITWYAMVDGLYRVFFSHQIPLTPDLEVKPSGFRFQEVRGTTDPIRISVMISNVGRADSNSHWVEVSYSLDGSEPFVTVMDLRMEIPMAPDENYTFERSMSLPQGNIRFRLRIHDVTPYENNRLNNVIMRWFFVSNNNPPTVLVELPEDGSTLRKTMTIKGVTDDRDVGGVVTTSMTGLPSLPMTIEGRGPWYRTLDLSDVPSGVYVLSFQAYDGDYFSDVVYRKVRIARADDELRLISIHPSGDVTLLEGERYMFYFNATDPLTSTIDYRWGLGSDEWVPGGNAFLFEAFDVGNHKLRVEVTNGFTSLSHSWNITVIELIAPSIGGVEPAGPDVTLRKEEEERFSIEVSNPHEQPFTLRWTLGGQMISGEESKTVILSFESSGHYSLSVRLFATSSQDSMTWEITVTNEAPEIVSWTPLNLTLVIDDDKVMVFEVEAFDADSDLLRYVWSVDGEVLVGEETQGCSIDLPFMNMTDYQIIVSVSDGEEHVEHLWTVHPQSIVRPEDPNESHGDGGPWRTVPVGLLVLGVIIVVVVLSYLYVRWKEV
jgi:hypothetical protein